MRNDTFNIWIERNRERDTVDLHIYTTRGDGRRMLKASPVLLSFDLETREAQLLSEGEPTLRIQGPLAKEFFRALGNALLVQGISTAVTEPLEREMQRLEAHNNDLKSALNTALNTIAAMGRAKTRKEELEEGQEARRHHPVIQYTGLPIGGGALPDPRAKIHERRVPRLDPRFEEAVRRGLAGNAPTVAAPEPPAGAEPPF